MTLRYITTLTIKISGVVLFVLVVARLPEYLKTYLTDSVNSGANVFWAYFLSLIIPAVIALLLFTFPRTVANRIVEYSSDEPETQFNFEIVEMLLVRILGLALLYYAVSDLVFHIANLLHVRKGLGSDFSMHAYNYSYFIATIVELVIAFWLLAGTKSVIKFMQNLRRY